MRNLTDKKMTKEQFIEHYFNGIDEEEKEEFLSENTIKKCSCKDEKCKGWAMISNRFGDVI